MCTLDSTALQFISFNFSDIDLTWVKEPFTVAGIDFRYNYMSGSVYLNDVKVTFHIEHQPDGKQVLSFDPSDLSATVVSQKLDSLVRAIRDGWTTSEIILGLEMFETGTYDYVAVTEPYNDDLHAEMEFPATIGFVDKIDGQHIISVAERKYHLAREEAIEAFYRWKLAVASDSQLECTCDETSVIVNITFKNHDIEPLNYRLPKITTKRWHLGESMPSIMRQLLRQFHTHALKHDADLLFYGMFPNHTEGDI